MLCAFNRITPTIGNAISTVIAIKQFFTALLGRRHRHPPASIPTGPPNTSDNLSIGGDCREVNCAVERIFAVRIRVGLYVPQKGPLPLLLFSPTPHAASSRPERSAVERTPHFALAYALRISSGL